MEYDVQEIQDYRLSVIGARFRGKNGRTVHSEDFAVREDQLYRYVCLNLNIIGKQLAGRPAAVYHSGTSMYYLGKRYSTVP